MLPQADFDKANKLLDVLILQLHLTLHNCIRLLCGCYFRLAPSFLLQCIFSQHHDILGVLTFRQYVFFSCIFLPVQCTLLFLHIFCYILLLLQSISSATPLQEFQYCAENPLQIHVFIELLFCYFQRHYKCTQSYPIFLVQLYGTHAKTRINLFKIVL